METGSMIPAPNPSAQGPEMDIEEPIYLHLQASSKVNEIPAGVVAS